MGCDLQVQEVPFFQGFDLRRCMITCLLTHSGSLTSMVIIFHCTLFIHCNIFWYIMTNYYCTYVCVMFCMYVEIAFHTVFITLHYCSILNVRLQRVLWLGIVALQNELIP
jgi:hypothetical protein